MTLGHAEWLGLMDRSVLKWSSWTWNRARLSSDYRMGPGNQHAWAEVRIQTSHSYEVPAGNCLTIRPNAGQEIAGRWGGGRPWSWGGGGECRPGDSLEAGEFGPQSEASIWQSPAEFMHVFNHSFLISKLNSVRELNRAWNTIFLWGPPVDLLSSPT